MSDLYLEVSAYGGTHGKTACRELAALATQLRITVWLQFNDVRVLARPDENGDLIWRSLSYWLEQKGDYKCAKEEDGADRPEPADSAFAVT